MNAPGLLHGPCAGASLSQQLRLVAAFARDALVYPSDDDDSCFCFDPTVLLLHRSSLERIMSEAAG